MNWVAIARTVTLPSLDTVVPRLCSANSPERCSVLGSMRSTLLGGLTLIVSAVNTIMLSVAATKTPTPKAHINSVFRIQLSCTSCGVSDMVSPPCHAEGRRGCRPADSRERAVQRRSRPARPRPAGQSASRTQEPSCRHRRRLQGLSRLRRADLCASRFTSKRYVGKPTEAIMAKSCTSFYASATASTEDGDNHAPSKWPGKCPAIAFVDDKFDSIQR